VSRLWRGSPGLKQAPCRSGGTTFAPMVALTRRTLACGREATRPRKFVRTLTFLQLFVAGRWENRRESECDRRRRRWHAGCPSGQT
jgi:hypothetical protein